MSSRGLKSQDQDFVVEDNATEPEHRYVARFALYWPVYRRVCLIIAVQVPAIITCASLSDSFVERGSRRVTRFFSRLCKCFRLLTVNFAYNFTHERSLYEESVDLPRYRCCMVERCVSLPLEQKFISRGAFLPSFSSLSFIFFHLLFPPPRSGASNPAKGFGAVSSPRLGGDNIAAIRHKQVPWERVRWLQ